MTNITLCTLLLIIVVWLVHRFIYDYPDRFFRRYRRLNQLIFDAPTLEDLEVLHEEVINMNLRYRDSFREQLLLSIEYIQARKEQLNEKGSEITR